jgi:hypothetical protein
MAVEAFKLEKRQPCSLCVLKYEYYVIFKL